MARAEKRKLSPSADQPTLGRVMSRKSQHTEGNGSPHQGNDVQSRKPGPNASAPEFKPADAAGESPKLGGLFGPPLPTAWSVAGTSRSLLVGQFGSPADVAIKRLDNGGTPEDCSRLATFALFDLDWTLIKPKPGSNKKDKRFPNPRDEYDFVFLYPNVARKIQEAHARGHVIVICSNQLQKAPPAPRRGQKSTFQPDSTSNIQTWKKKVTHIVKGLGVPAYVLASLLKDEYRKPHAAMWWYLRDHVWAGQPASPVSGPHDGGAVQRLGRSKAQIALPINASPEAQSYFVGDLAGRIAHAGNSFAADFRDTDRKFALNAGLAFFTPETYFLGHELPQGEHLELRGFDARMAIENSDPSADKLPSWLPDEGAAGAPTQLVLFVGAPGAGKSSYYRRIFQPRGYVHLNQDTLGTRAKCIKEARANLSENRSVVIDNTNRDKATRAHYLEIAQELGIPAYCVHFKIPIEQAWHQNVSRGLGGGDVGVIPAIAYTSYRSAFQAPEQSEGLAAPPFEVPWVFVGNEEHKAHYGQWFATMEEYQSRGGPK